MKKRILSLILAIAMMLTSSLYLMGCNGSGDEKTEAPTGVPTEEPTSGIESEQPTETPTETPTEEPTTDETEMPTEAPVDLDDVLYENGEEVKNAGLGWDDEVFALGEYNIDESKAVDKTAADILALLTDKTAMAAGEVYRVTEPLVLSSNTKYYGNLAGIIATQGIIIKDAEEIVIKELLVKGDITVENSKGITFFKLDVKAGDVGINVSGESSDIAFKNCKVYAADTAIKTEADMVTFFQCYLSADKGVITSGDDVALQGTHIVSVSKGVENSGDSCTVRGNLIELATDGVGVEYKGGANGLVAQNVIKDAQMSIKVTDGYNCVVLLNSAIRVYGEKNTNLYVVENNLGGAIELYNNEYLICENNTFVTDDKPHGVSNIGNTKYNGNTLQNVNARNEHGANEDLLPHTNKDLFVGMERQIIVRDASFVKSYNIDQYITYMARDNDVVIVPPGAYISPSPLLMTAVHSNTNIYAYGVYHEAVEYGNTCKIANASNVSIHGMTIGYAKQSSGQAHILDKLGDRKLLVISSAGFGDTFGKADSTRFSGDSGAYLFAKGSFTSWSEIGAWGSYSIVPNADGSIFNEDGAMVIELKGTHAAKYYSAIGEGDLISCRLAGDNQQTVTVSSCANILFKDCVTYGYAAALMFVVGGTSTNVRYERLHNAAQSAAIIDEATYKKYEALETKYGVDLEVYTDELGRYRGSASRIGSVDATHITGSKQGITAISSLFENACDDASNHNGSSSRLHKVIDNKDGTTTLVYKATISEVYYNMYKNRGYTSATGTETRDFAVGDRIFVYASNGKVLCDTTVLTATKLHQKEKLITRKEDYQHKASGKWLTMTWSCYLYEVKVKTADLNLDAIEGYDLNDNHYKMDQKVIVDNISRNSAGAVFDNCMVRNNRGRIVVKTRDVSITNCTFKDTTYAAIVLSVESTWGESSVPQNVDILNCVFDGVSQTINEQNNTKYAAIAVQGLGDAATKVTASEETLPSKNIRIEGNIFKHVANNYYITLLGCKDVTIKNNVFEPRNNESASRVGKAVLVSGCINVEISDNTYSNNADGDMTKLIVANNFKSLTGSDVTNEDGTPIFPDNVTE